MRVPPKDFRAVSLLPAELDRIAAASDGRDARIVAEAAEKIRSVEALFDRSVLVETKGLSPTELEALEIHLQEQTQVFMAICWEDEGSPRGWPMRISRDGLHAAMVGFSVVAMAISFFVCLEAKVGPWVTVGALLLSPAMGSIALLIFISVVSVTWAAMEKVLNWFEVLK